MILLPQLPDRQVSGGKVSQHLVTLHACALGCGVSGLLLAVSRVLSRRLQRKSPLRRANMSTSDFYLRYYVGHKGKFGHEFLEFEFRPDGEFKMAEIEMP